MKVSCEHHDDEGGYHETTVALGFNYRETFNTFIIRLTKTSLAWLVVEGGAGGGGGSKRSPQRKGNADATNVDQDHHANQLS